VGPGAGGFGPPGGFAGAAAGGPAGIFTSGPGGVGAHQGLSFGTGVGPQVVHEREPPNYAFGSPGAAPGAGGGWGAPGGPLGGMGARAAPGFGAPGSQPVGRVGVGVGAPGAVGGARSLGAVGGAVGAAVGAPVGSPPGALPASGSGAPGFGAQTGSPPGYREARASGPARPVLPMPTAPPFTAFVGNFPYECSQEEVVGLFTANACAILDVRMVRNRDTDRPRGYFLEFEDLPSLERALGFDQYVLGGRPLRVNVAEGRPERRDRDRDRYGGGGGFAERYDRDRGGGDGRRGGFAERYADGPRDAGFVGGGASFGRREGGGGYQEAREGRGGRNSRMHDDDRPRRRSFDRPADRVLPSDGPAPEGRKKLVLAARSVPADGGAAPETPENKADASSKPNPFGAARPVDSSAKIAEAERKIKEERDALHAKAGAKAEGGVPAPKPKPLSKSSVQPPVTKRGPLIMAPKEEPVIKAKNAFELLSMDDSGDDEDDEEE
jgi:translation initiation factor 4B